MCTSSVLGTLVKYISFKNNYLQFIVQTDFPKEVEEFLWFNTVKQVFDCTKLMVSLPHVCKLTAVQQHMLDSESAVATDTFWNFFSCKEKIVGEFGVANF